VVKEFHLEKLISILIKEKLIPAKTKDIKEIKFFKGKGCDKCGHTGYKGRLGMI
jgi:type II secretory ATPase GspE/PulE/Tfp pilus assembly ATPase PilB-like protein